MPGTLLRTLVEHGALEPGKPGPKVTGTAEEVKQRQRESKALSAKRRKELAREAREKGEPFQTLSRGRRRKYTPEEALEVRRVCGKIHTQTFKERIKAGLASLEAMRRSHDEGPRSTDERFFPVAI